MARTAAPANGYSIAQLQKLMQSRQTEVNRLTRKRDTLQRKVDALH